MFEITLFQYIIMGPFLRIKYENMYGSSHLLQYIFTISHYIILLASLVIFIQINVLKLV